MCNVFSRLICLNRFITAAFYTQGSDSDGGEALANIRHAPVNRSPFLHLLVTECPLHKFTPNDLLFLLFFNQHFQTKSSNLKNIFADYSEIFLSLNVQIARILYNFTSNGPLPFYGSVTLEWPLFFRKLSLIAPCFHVSVGTTQSLFMWVPPTIQTNVTLVFLLNMHVIPRGEQLQLQCPSHYAN